MKKRVTKEEEFKEALKCMRSQIPFAGKHFVSSWNHAGFYLKVNGVVQLAPIVEFKGNILRISKELWEKNLEWVNKYLMYPNFLKVKKTRKGLELSHYLPHEVGFALAGSGFGFMTMVPESQTTPSKVTFREETIKIFLPQGLNL